MLPPQSDPRRLFALCCPLTALAASRDYRKLDPRPCPSSYPALFTRGTDKRFSGSDCRPTTSATALYSIRGHTLEHPILAFARIPPHGWGTELTFAFHRPSPGSGLPLAKKIAKAASRDSPSHNARSDCCKRSRSMRPRKPLPDLDAACGQRLNPAGTCGGNCWTKAQDCTDREASSEGPSSHPLLPQRA